MERVQAIALAVVIAALVLFGLGHVLEEPAAEGWRGGTAGAMVEDGAPRRVALAGGTRESRRAPGRPPRADADGGETRRTRRAAVIELGSAELIAGAPRRGATGGGAAGARERASALVAALPDPLRAARLGAVPRAGGGGGGAAGGEIPDGPLFEFVDDEEPRGAAADVLLSLPLDGSVDPEKGVGPTRADGVLVSEDGVEFTETAQVVVPSGGNVRSEAGTISFAIEPRWAGADPTNHSLLQIRNEHQWENSLGLVKNNDVLRYIIRDERGVETNVNIPIPDWQPNEPHTITATWGDGVMALYLDGVLAGESPLPNPLDFRSDPPIYVGSDFATSTYAGAGARIAQLKVYGRALAAEEIGG